MAIKESISRWYPNETQLKNPRAVKDSFRQVLDQLYSLQDSHSALVKRVAEMPLPEAKGKFPPGSGPTDTQLLGLNVEPIDTNSLANGTALKYNKARGTFSFQ